MADSVMALASKDLKLTDYFTPRNRSWMTKKDLDMGSISPTIFNFKSWELAATSGKEGVIFLLDTKSLGGADHRVPLYRSPLMANEEVNFAGKGFWALSPLGKMPPGHAGCMCLPGVRPRPRPNSDWSTARQPMAA